MNRARLPPQSQASRRRERARIGKFGSGRYRLTTLAQADILQLGKHAGGDRLGYDKDLTELVRLIAFSRSKCIPITIWPAR
jgi:hypothetical protein